MPRPAYPTRTDTRSLNFSVSSFRLFPSSRRAFTLIELLTVVAIIGILASIAFVGLRSVRLAARRSESISNLRQIGISFSLYAQDNRDDLPTIQTGAESTYWWSHVSPYLNGGTKASDWSAFTRVPTLRSTYQSQKIADHTGKAWLNRTPSYSMNWYLNYTDSSNANFRLLKLSSIPHPSQTLLCSEAAFNTANQFTGLKPEHLEIAAGEAKGGSLVYNGGAIGGTSHFLWIDGHVSSIKDAKKYGWGDPYGPGKSQSIWNRGF